MFHYEGGHKRYKETMLIKKHSHFKREIQSIPARLHLICLCQFSYNREPRRPKQNRNRKKHSQRNIKSTNGKKVETKLGKIRRVEKIKTISNTQHSPHQIHGYKFKINFLIRKTNQSTMFLYEIILSSCNSNPRRSIPSTHHLLPPSLYLLAEPHTPPGGFPRANSGS